MPMKGWGVHCASSDQEQSMSKRVAGVALALSALALPSAALADGHDAPGKAKARPPKAVNFLFRGVYKGEGVVLVRGGNARVRKGDFVGTEVTFDLSGARV